MAEYRWNQQELAAGYDVAAQHIHPHYLELQETLLNLLPCAADDEFLLVDAGGGSGRFAARFLNRFPNATAVIIDQSQPFLDLARQKLAAVGSRAHFVLARLQEDWQNRLPAAPTAIVSMSAIHHLDPAEKQDLYGRCHECLLPAGVLLNGDEVRPAEDAAYLAACRNWAAHMHRVIDAGLIPAPLCDALRKWEARNVGEFGQPRVSGDDCHETIATQLEYFRSAGFQSADAPWHQDLWAVLRGVKAPA